ncbi:2-oxoglutarate-dependent dioxygenase family protein [Thalictrum thalictroides]|uniref:2-oxoglutarate-dependent dioxygenase family protein n=1 Tax=Thalictrum thalictroides TaxID=46969 RepID=A0A7J6V2J2_THATH|nr:2-oxoglutarate-dependent dioxygenase family protein [Thalictrum thalictroides]
MNQNQRRGRGWFSNLQRSPSGSNSESPNQQNQGITSISANSKGRSSYIKRPLKGWSSMGVVEGSGSRNSQDASIVDTCDERSRPSPMGRSPGTTLSNFAVRHNVCAPVDDTSSMPFEVCSVTTIGPFEIAQDIVMLHSSSDSSENEITQPMKTSPWKEYSLNMRVKTQTRILHHGKLHHGQDEVSLHESPEHCTDRIPQARKASPKRESSCSDHVVGKTQTITTFDICPKKHSTVVLKRSLLETNKEKRKDIERSMQGHVILRPGMVLLRNFITHADQINIVKKCRELGVGHGGFYQPGYSDGAKLSLQMMCLGKSWDPQTKSYEESRCIDGAKPPTIPDTFKKLVGEAIHASHAIIRGSTFFSRKSSIRNPADAIPWMEPDVCIVNFYAQSGKLGLHQDVDESQESLKNGLPVVSFSIGDSAEFLYGDDRDADKAEKVELKSGDVLVFGGKSRLIFHGVPSIVKDSAPRFLADEADLRPGRLNLTFRKY